MKNYQKHLQDQRSYLVFILSDIIMSFLVHRYTWFLPRMAQTLLSFSVTLKHLVLWDSGVSRCGADSAASTPETESSTETAPLEGKLSNSSPQCLSHWRNSSNDLLPKLLPSEQTT
jgi:hypothetical protein